MPCAGPRDPGAQAPMPALHDFPVAFCCVAQHLPQCPGREGDRWARRNLLEGAEKPWRTEGSRSEIAALWVPSCESDAGRAPTCERAMRVP